MRITLDKLTAVILAAGKGSRMGLKGKNKVTCEVEGEPIILKTIQNLKRTGITNIVIVVGHQKNSVLSLLDNKTQTVEQRKRLGTGHAVKVALKKIEADQKVVLVLNGDDSFLYTPEILQQLINQFYITRPSIYFLTTEVSTPTGLGRIIRDNQRKVIGIVEEKNASEDQKKIKEINPACYLFDKQFLLEYINKIPKDPLKREYYLTNLISLAVLNKKPVEALNIPDLKWQGINTPEELLKASQPEVIILEVGS